MDRGNEAVLVLLDLTSAFDTVDHSILLTRLMERFGVNEVASDWFASYLSGRQQRVMIQDVTSDPAPLLWGVPQGSELGHSSLFAILLLLKTLSLLMVFQP